MNNTRVQTLMQRGLSPHDAMKVASVFDRLDKLLDKQKDYTPLEMSHALMDAFQEISEKPKYTEQDLQDAIQELRDIMQAKQPKKRILGLEVNA